MKDDLKKLKELYPDYELMDVSDSVRLSIYDKSDRYFAEKAWKKEEYVKLNKKIGNIYYGVSEFYPKERIVYTTKKGDSFYYSEGYY